MASVAAGAAIASTASTVIGGRRARKAQKKAAKQAEAMGRENARLIGEENRENLRRANERVADVEASSRAKVAASGTARGPGDSSGGLYRSLDAQSEEHQRQLEWMEQAGEAEEKLALTGAVMAGDLGRAQADLTQAQTFSSLFSGVGNVYSSGSTAGWWR